MQETSQLLNTSEQDEATPSVKAQAAGERGAELFRSGFYCAESVLKSVAETLEISSDLIPRIASGFCSGVARSGSLCGALSGGIMGVGLATGCDAPTQSKDAVYELTSRLSEAFVARYGSSNCTALLQLDLGDPQQNKLFGPLDKRETVCIPMVRFVAEYVVSQLEHEGYISNV